MKKIKYGFLLFLILCPCLVSAEVKGTEENSYPYLIKYYKDEVSEDGYLGCDEGFFPKDTMLTEENIDINKYMPLEYDKAYTDRLPYTMQEKNNDIIVVYVKNTYPYHVEYYKDEVKKENLLLTSSDVYHELDVTLSEETLKKDLGEQVLEVALPKGYQIHTIYHLNEAMKKTENVIQILYTKRKDLSYRVEYYYDGELTHVNEYYNQTYNEEITGFDLGEKDGYLRVAISHDNLNYTSNPEENVIQIYYESKEKIDRFKGKIKAGITIFLIVYENLMSYLHQTF